MDKIVATIGSEPVTQLEVKKILRDHSNSQIKEAPSEMDIREAILVVLFNREASRLGVDITDEDINDYIRRVEISNGGGSGSIEQSLGAQGMTLDKYKDKIRSELLKSRVLAMNLRSQVQVSDEEVERYLGGSESQSRDGYFLVQVNYPIDIPLEAVEKMESYLKVHKKCFPYDEFKSECINMGEIKVEDLKEEIKSAVEDLELYEAARLEPLGSDQNAIFYIRVESNFSTESGETFSKIKDQIFQKKFMEKANEFVSKDIFESYAVEIY